MPMPHQGVRTPLGSEHSVSQQHCPGHRTDATDAGRHPSRHLGRRLLDVGQEPLSFPRHSSTDHCRARLDHVAVDEVREASGRHHDVSLAHVVAEVGNTGVHDRHCGVKPWPLERQQQGEGPTYREPTADDDDVLATDGNVIGMKQLDYPGRSAGKRPWCAHHEPPEVHRMQPVNVLVRIDCEQRPLLV